MVLQEKQVQRVQTRPEPAVMEAPVTKVQEVVEQSMVVGKKARELQRQAAARRFEESEPGLLMEVDALVFPERVTVAAKKSRVVLVMVIEEHHAMVADMEVFRAEEDTTG